MTDLQRPESNILLRRLDRATPVSASASLQRPTRIVSTGNAQLVEGTSGSDSITAYGNHDTILGHGGKDTIVSSGGGTTIDVGPSARATVDLQSSAHDSVSGLNGAFVLQSEAGGGHNHIALGNGDDSVRLAGHGNVVVLGNGDDTVSAGSSGDSITLGGGTSLVFLGQHDTLFTQGFGTIDATGEGADTITTSQSASVNILLHGANNVVTTGGASDAISDSAVGHNAFFLHGGGDTRFTSFALTSQVVLASSDGYSSGADVLAHVRDTPGGAVLQFGGGNTGGQVQFLGVMVSELHSGNFTVV